MELKTKVQAALQRQDLVITREFDLPVEALFRAYVEAALVEEWMGTKVIKLDTRQHGGYRFETTDPKGNKHGFHGVIHDLIPNQRLIRTFEMESSSFGPQLEFLEFEKRTESTSQLKMHIVYRSREIRDAILKLPFAQGINMAHDRLQHLFHKKG